MTISSSLRDKLLQKEMSSTAVIHFNSLSRKLNQVHAKKLCILVVHPTHILEHFVSQTHIRVNMYQAHIYIL